MEEGLRAGGEEDPESQQWPWTRGRLLLSPAHPVKSPPQLPKACASRPADTGWAPRSSSPQCQPVNIPALSLSFRGPWELCFSHHHLLLLPHPLSFLLGDSLGLLPPPRVTKERLPLLGADWLWGFLRAPACHMGQGTGGCFVGQEKSEAGLKLESAGGVPLSRPSQSAPDSSVGPLSPLHASSGCSLTPACVAGASITTTSRPSQKRPSWGTLCCKQCEPRSSGPCLGRGRCRGAPERAEWLTSVPCLSSRHFYDNPIQSVGRSAFQCLPKLHTL